MYLGRRRLGDNYCLTFFSYFHQCDNTEPVSVQRWSFVQIELGVGMGRGAATRTRIRNYSSIGLAMRSRLQMSCRRLIIEARVSSYFRGGGRPILVGSVLSASFS